MHGTRVVGHRVLDERSDREVVDDRGIRVGAHALQDEREAREHLPFVELSFVERHHGRRVVGHVAHTELQQREVVVRLRQRIGHRQDHIGVRVVSFT